MQTLDFDQTVESIIESDDRFAAESYYFLRDALDVTHRELKKRHGQDHQAQHVSGRQLLEGIRQHALEEFGPMSLTVLTEWGITRCEDFGEIVFNIAERMMVEVLVKAFNKEKKEVREVYKREGDLGNVAEEFSSRDSSTLSVVQVFERLEKIAKLEIW